MIFIELKRDEEQKTRVKKLSEMLKCTTTTTTTSTTRYVKKKVPRFLEISNDRKKKRKN
jgi:hypothetical protein